MSLVSTLHVRAVSFLRVLTCFLSRYQGLQFFLYI